MTGLLLGFLLGFIMQRGRFCMAGGLRDLYLFKDARMLIAILIVISIQSLGLIYFVAKGWAGLPAGPFFWLATLVGGILFGMGMALAGSCSTGACYRAAEGLAASIAAVAGFVLASWLIRQPGAKPLVAGLRSWRTDNATLTDTFHISPLTAATVLSLLTIALAVRHLKKPSPPVARLRARRAGVMHWLFEARWHPFVSALLIGAIALLAWASSMATGRPGGLGISGPSAQLFSLIAQGNTAFFGWAGLLLCGLFLGSLAAAVGSRECRLRYPGHREVAKGACGGLLMGIGSGIAGGCMLGNTLVNTAWFAWQGWAFIPAILLGSWLVNYVLIIRPMTLSLTHHG